MCHTVPVLAVLVIGVVSVPICTDRCQIKWQWEEGCGAGCVRQEDESDKSVSAKFKNIKFRVKHPMELSVVGGHGHDYTHL